MIDAVMRFNIVACAVVFDTLDKGTHSYVYIYIANEDFYYYNISKYSCIKK